MHYLVLVFVLLGSFSMSFASKEKYLVVKEDSTYIATKPYQKYDSVKLLQNNKVVFKSANRKDSILMNFSGFEDNLYLLQFSSSLPDKKKKTETPLILDRNPRLKTKSHVSEFLLGRRDSDEVMQKLQWEKWKAEKNYISFVSLWDKDSLYFLVRIHDSNLIHNEYSGKDFPYCTSDAIALLFDTEHKHSHLTSPGDLKLYIDVQGNSFLYLGTYGADSLVLQNKKISTKVHLQGTLNNPFDNDISVLYRISIPWKMLGINPKANVVIGFDIINYNLNNTEGPCDKNAWSGEKLNFRNPSEWGNLVLYRDNNLGRIFLMFFIVLILLFNFFYLIHRKNKYDSETIDDIHITNFIHDFIIKNLNDQALSVNSIARYMNLRANYINNLFLQIKKISIQDAISSERKKLASSLKKQAHISETEIIRRTGLKSKEDLYKLLDD